MNIHNFHSYKKLLYIIALSCTIIIASCGSDNNGIDYKDEKGKPVADAKAFLLGAPITAEPTTYQTRANSEVTLTGKDSNSDYAPILKFDWEQIDSTGYTVELIERNDSTSSFNVPNVNTRTQLQFKLTITDANGESDDDLVYIDITPGNDADHFITHPNDGDNQFYLKAVLDAADFTEIATAHFSFDIVTIAHWIRRDGTNDQLEIKRESIDGEFPANFAPDITYDGINDTRNPAFIINIPRINADDINKHFETVERERRVERYLIDDIVLETKIVLTNNNGGKNFKLFALDSIDPTIDLTTHIKNLTNLIYEEPLTFRTVNRHRVISELLTSTDADTEVSLSVTKLLSAMRLESYISANNYYQLLDPEGKFEKLEDWFVYAGFKDNLGNWINTDVAHALYVNNYDLGFGRDMYSRKDANGNVYTFVVNYPTMEAGMKKLGEFALVAMEYSDNPDPLGTNAKIVKFYAYIYDEREGGFVRAKSLNFDGRGEKYVPGSCTGCHQGTVGGKDFLEPAEADLDATYLPWDVSAFLFADAKNPKYIETTLKKDDFTDSEIALNSREAQESQIRQLNLQALATYTADPARHTASIELVHGWYGDESNSLPVDQLPDTTFNEAFTPAGWSAQSELYLEVFSPHCRMCHTQLSSTTKDFNTYDEFINNSKLVNYVYERGLMPLARMSMDRFWSSIYNSTSAAELLRLHLESLGHTVPEFAGLPIPSIKITPDGIGIATSGDVITINASASLFTTKFNWSLTPPFGSTTTLGSTTGPITSFQADMPGGNYDLELTVYNANGDSATLNTTISIINRTPIAECLNPSAATITAAGALANIPVVSQLTQSQGDGGVYISNVINGSYGTATIDQDARTISYQLNDPFIRGVDTIYYQTTDFDGSVSTTDANPDCDNNGNSGYASITIDSTPTGELNPGSFTALRDTIKNTYEIDLSWAAPTGITAESYNLYIVGNSTPIANIAAPTTTYSHTVIPDTAYNYEVTAVIGSSESTPSSSASASTLALLPGGLSASAVSTSQINLSWSAPTGNVSSYKIYRDSTYLTSTSSTSYSNTGLTAGQTYSYTVSAVDGLPQESTQIGPDSETVIPATPTGLILTLGTNDPTAEIKLDWTVPSGVRDLFCIYRDGTAVGTTTNNSYLDTGLASYHLYTYYVTAVSDVTSDCFGVESASSNAPSLRTDPTGGATTEPTLDSATVNVTNDASQIDLSWAPATSYTATGYKVYHDNGGLPPTLVATLGNVTSYSNTGLTYNTSYSYKVSALYDPGNGSTAESGYSNIITRSTDNLVPSGVGGSATSTTAITVTWSAPAANVDSSGYTIYRDSNPIAIGTSSSTTFNDTGLTEGTIYAYTITAKQGSQTSSQSVAGNVATKPTAPSAPTFGAQTTTSLIVNWAAPDLDSGYTYNVDYSTDNSIWTNLLSGTASTSTTHNSLAPATLYYYRVSAIKNGVASAYSSSSSKGTVPSTPSAPGATDGTSASQITVTWVNGTGLTYNIYRNGSGTPLAAGTGVTSPFNDTTVTKGTTYTYKIAAIANSVVSAQSNSDSGYTIPDTPTGLSVSSTSGKGAVLSWTAPASGSVDSYKVYANNVDVTANTVFIGASGTVSNLSSQTAYTFKVSTIYNSAESSTSSTSSGTTKVSYTDDISGGVCSSCHTATYYDSIAEAAWSTNYPGTSFLFCATTNGKGCHLIAGTGATANASATCTPDANWLTNVNMCFPDNDASTRQLITNWLTRGANKYDD